VRLLLDTCTFFWWMGEDAALSPTAAAAITEPTNSCALSVVSLWEILVKHAAGRLAIDSGAVPPFDFLAALCAEERIDILPLGPEAVRHVTTLPDLHRDPFDRLLICQAIEHGLTLVTPDSQIRRYPIKTMWQ
jgi:PIN domain nuclease of toxin-antitoxin system